MWNPWEKNSTKGRKIIFVGIFAFVGLYNIGISTNKGVTSTPIMFPRNDINNFLAAKQVSYWSIGKLPFMGWVHDCFVEDHH